MVSLTCSYVVLLSLCWTSSERLSLIGSWGLERERPSGSKLGGCLWGPLRRSRVEDQVPVTWPQLSSCIHCGSLPRHSTAVSPSLYSHSLLSSFLAPPLWPLPGSTERSSLCHSHPASGGKVKFQNRVSWVPVGQRILSSLFRGFLFGKAGMI